MAKKISMTRNQNDDDASSREKFKGWSDLNHDVLFLVMMQLGFIDFLSFSRVCKSWRLFARPNRKMFIASRLPMQLRITRLYSNKRRFYCDIVDPEGTKFKTPLPHSARSICFGSTCGYLILFGKNTRDFWLVNPMTKDQLHFPSAPIFVHCDHLPMIKAILVFSPSISKWVFIILNKSTHKTCFSIVGSKGAWNPVVSNSHFLDLHAFKGNIYTIDRSCRVYEMKLNPEPTLTLLDIDNYRNPNFVSPEFVNSGENLYVVNQSFEYKVVELDLGRMMWVSPEKTYAIFISNLGYPLAINPEAWVDPPSQYQRYTIFPDSTKKGRIYKLFTADIWYFPYSCFNDNLLHE